MKNFLLKFTKNALVCFFVLTSSMAFSQTATAPSNGDGTEGNPYEISSLENLYWLTQNSAEWDKHYIQTANINASGSSSWDSNKGLKPIGNSSVKFTGAYNGKGHTISNVIINRTSWQADNLVGFFGYIENGQIDSLGLINANVDGYKELGVFASYNKGIINSCYTQGGSVDCGWGETMGGFVAINYSAGTIQNCYSTIGIRETAGAYAESENLGGLVGINYGTINKCYATGRIYGNEDIGGLVGDNGGTITNCFSTGDPSGYYANNYGGIAGRNSGTIKNCYSTGDVGYYTYDKGGVVGENYGSVKNCFYELLEDGGNGKAGIGLTAEEMKNFKNYFDADWDYFDETYNGTDDIWGLNTSDNNGYPFLKWQGYTNSATYECEAPFSATKKVIFENISKNSLELDSITKGGYMTTGYVVFINTTKTWTAPDNTIIPVANSTWQNSGQQCIYSGTSQKPEIVVTNLSPETLFYFKTYAYNECSGEELYETAGKIDSVLTFIENEQPNGDGSEGSPYEIETLTNLSWLMYNDTTWDKNFIQIADINASKTYVWNDSTGFIPIGNATVKFTGSYNGKGHAIDSLCINKPTSFYIGLFGRTDSDAQLDSLGLTNTNFIGKEIIGGLCGYNNGTINSCFTTGIVSSNPVENARIGGLVGENRKSVYNCYSSVNVAATNGDYAGGLIGRNYGSTALVKNSYSTGNSTGRYGIGGFTGGNESSAKIKNCYSYGVVSTSSSSYKGGFNGYTTSGGIIENCFWDTETSTLTTSIGGATGLTTAQMKDYRAYLEDGWDFIDETYNGTEDIWGYNNSENNAYPFLYWQAYTNNFTCEAPFSPSSEIIIRDIQTNSFVIDSITNTGYGKIGTIIYINSEDAWTIPSDGETPIANSVWQDSGQQCIFIGSSVKPELTISNLDKNKKYYIKAFVYNECAGTKKYEQTGLLADLYTTSEFTQPIGDGSDVNPYEIASLENLAWLMYNDTVWDKKFIQTNDINASETIEWQDSTGFNPIGSSSIKFSGIYNGKGYEIDSLCINRETKNYIGLFGYTNDSQIDSIGLTNVDIKGNTYVGGIVGYQIGTINSCYVTGIVTGKLTDTYTYARVGGLIGQCSGTVTNCHCNIEVKSTIYMAGGLIGYLSSGSIENSYSKGTVSGNIRVGGLIGDNRGTIKNCYSTSDVTGNYDIGGLVGYNPGKVYSSYSIGEITGTGNSDIGGLIGDGSESNTFESFWDTETSGLEISNGGTGLTSVQMKTFKNYLEVNWDFLDETYNGSDDIWGLNDSENSGYPFLNWEGYTHTATLDCQAPLNPSSGIIIGDVKVNSIVIDSLLKGGYITAGYVGYINSENTFVAPVNDSEPTANTEWQNTGQQCIYIGTSQKPSITVTGLNANTQYYFKVYGYNDCSGNYKFEQSGIETNELTKLSNTLPEGDGTIANPYFIENLDDLTWVMYNDTAWNKHYVQTADINASTTVGWPSGTGFNPIGNSTVNFTGSYNGKGHIIDSLYIDRPSTSNIGLFGLIDNSQTKIDSLGVTNINITGNTNIGAIVGYMREGSISNSFSTGECISESIESWAQAGGFIGNNYYGIIANCYTHANIHAEGLSNVGGFVGPNRGTITNCYSTGKVIGSSSTGGFVGKHYTTGSISNSFWDTETSGQATSAEATGKASFQIKNRYTFIDEGWDFANETDNGTNDIWNANCSENDGYPFLSWQGLENICEAPSEAVSEIIISSVSSNSIKLESFTPVACGTKGYVTYINTVDSWTNPTDGENPTTNTDWQNNGQQCIYNGTSISPDITINNLTSCAAYYIKVYAYNTCNETSLYETTGFVKENGLVDNEVPVAEITTLPEITGQCSVTISESPTATDNCAGSVTGTTANPLIYTQQGTYTITWTYDDDNGNVSTQTQIVIVDDETSPTISCVSNQNKVVSTNETVYTVVGTEFDPSSVADNCEVDSFYNDFNNLATLENAEFSLGRTAVNWTIVDVNGNASQCSFDITVSQSTGINNLEELGISIYPNPVNNVLNITSENENLKRITITDITGRIRYDKSEISKSEQIDLSSYNSGIYFVKLDNGKQIYTSKIIKK